VRHPPDRFQRRRVVGEAGNQVPMDVGELVAQQFVIDFLRLEDFGERFGDSVDFFHQLKAFGGREVEQLGGVALKDDDGPTGKELILMQVDLGEPQVPRQALQAGSVTADSPCAIPLRSRRPS
jgi:hypothetical protein